MEGQLGQVSFGLWLKQLRAEHDLTQKQLADLLVCSVSNIRKLESGVRRPSKELPEQLARHFDLEVSGIQRVVQLARIQPPTPTETSQAQSCNPFMSNILPGYKEELNAVPQISHLSEGCDHPTLIRAKALHLAGAMARVQSDFDQAYELHKHSLALYQNLRDDAGVATELEGLASVALNQGNHQRTLELATDSLILFRRLEDKYGIASSLNYLGWVNLEGGHWEQAVALYRESLRLAQELEDRQACRRALNNLGEAARLQGNYEQAGAFYSESLALAQELNDESSMASELHNLGHVSLHEADSRQAGSLFGKSLSLFWQLGDRQGIAECLAGVAGVVGTKGSLAHAARLLGATTSVLATVGSPLQLTDRIEYNENVAGIRRRLDAKTFTDAWETGRTMTPDRATAYALALPYITN